jgi:hypothetical protein
VSAEASGDTRADGDPADLGRLTRLLPVAVIAAAICLFASELMTMFELRPPGGESLCEQLAGDRHANAQMVVAGAAIIAVIAAVFGRSRPAAFAVAALGIVALLIFLISDLRVANTSGSLSSACGSTQGFLFEAKAIPQGGFYLELVGALALAVTGVALATLSPEQLGALRPAPRERTTEPRRDDRPKPPEHKPPDAPAKSRLSRLARPRARQRG